MRALLTSESVHCEIDDLLLSGEAQTASQAEEIWLDAHLDDLVRLVAELDEQTVAAHEAIKLLMSHGSRRWEDAL